MLKIQNACKKFGQTTIFDQINLSVTEKTIIGITGPSGSGKSTLLRCIQRLEPLTSGEIIVDEEIGFMFQDFQLFPHFNVLKNVTYALRFNHNIQNPIETATNLLTKLGLADKTECFPQQLSGGQKQRLALARSLAMRPTLLLCDEPTSGLDLLTIDEVVKLLKTINYMGVGMIIASHDLNFLTSIADRIIVLNKGKIITDFDPKFIENPLQHLKIMLNGNYHP